MPPIHTQAPTGRLPSRLTRSTLVGSARTTVRLRGWMTRRSGLRAAAGLMVERAARQVGRVAMRTVDDMFRVIQTDTEAEAARVLCRRTE